MRLFAAGAAARSTEATHLNPESSRSHCFISIRVESGGRVEIIDLAGSESIKKSGAPVVSAGFINSTVADVSNFVRAMAQGGGTMLPRSSITDIMTCLFGGPGTHLLIIATLTASQAQLPQMREALRFLEAALKIAPLIVPPPIAHREPAGGAATPRPTAHGLPLWATDATSARIARKMAFLGVPAAAAPCVAASPVPFCPASSGAPAAMPASECAPSALPPQPRCRSAEARSGGRRVLADPFSPGTPQYPHFPYDDVDEPPTPHRMRLSCEGEAVPGGRGTGGLLSGAAFESLVNERVRQLTLELSIENAELQAANADLVAQASAAPSWSPAPAARSAPSTHIPPPLAPAPLAPQLEDARAEFELELARARGGGGGVSKPCRSENGGAGGGAAAVRLALPLA